ncbi:MAG: glycosyltransferase [Leadbetterella sp.]|nr:glycosyltransferase [Leadbetterella sp.]
MIKSREKYLLPQAGKAPLHKGRHIQAYKDSRRVVYLYFDNDFMNHPKISILVPARNEEENLPVLLQSLRKLTYPKDKTEILLGNDGSDDRTGELMEEFARECRVTDHHGPEHQPTGSPEASGGDHPLVKVIHLREEKDNPLSGKTRVLDRLATQATGGIPVFYRCGH